MNSINSAMDIDEQKGHEDPLLEFIDYARSVLSPETDENLDPNQNGAETSTRPSWNWTASRILKTCSAYSSGVTTAILLSDLAQVLPLIEFLSLSLCLVAEKCGEMKERNNMRVCVWFLIGVERAA